MRRRDFALSMTTLTAAAHGLTIDDQKQTDASNPHASIPSGPPQQVAMVIYPNMTALDFLGPHTFLSALGNIRVHAVWKDTQPIKTDNGLQIIPSTSFVECPKNLDVLFIGGGSEGTLALMQDPETLHFLAEKGANARYITSVCTGSLVLGAAGLLRGYRATSHWAFRDLLTSLGADISTQRIVEDRNRITAGGVTAGIDFGLMLAAKLRSKIYAEMLQLAFEYDPQPPFRAGSPDVAPKEVDEHLQIMFQPLHRKMYDAAAACRKYWPA